MGRRPGAFRTDGTLAEMARLRAEGCTLQEIGGRFGLSRERVRQVLKDAPPAPKAYWTVPELCARFGCGRQALARQIAAAGFRTPGRRSHRLTARQVKALEASFRRACSECAAPDGANTRGGVLRALRAVRGVRDPGAFVPWKEALEASGLTKWRLGWLARRGVVTTREHPMRRHPVTGKPSRLFSRAEMEAIRRAETEGDRTKGE
jgi:Sigma-70, region 4